MSTAPLREPEELSIEQYRARSYNVLVPSQTMRSYSDMHEPVLEQVFISPNTDDGDVYEQEKAYGKKPAKYALTKQALMKLSSCAGIMWHPTETRRTDNRSDKDYISYQAVGGVRKSDGAWIFFKSEYDLDFEVIEMEIEESYRKKQAGYESDQENKWWPKMTSEQQEAYIQGCIRRDLLQKRKHKLKLAESGALNRVTRTLLGIKNTYTRKELESPFVVARVVFKPDYNDPAVRRQLTQASISAVTNIFGPAPVFNPGIRTAPTPSATDDIPVCHEFINIDPEPEIEPEAQPEAGGETVIQDDKPARFTEDDFRALTKEDKMSCLRDLAREAGEDLKTLTKQQPDWTMSDHFKYLTSKLDDIPF